MKNKKLLSVDLKLFDGAAAGDGGTSGSTAAQGDTQATPGSTRRGNTGEVKYGKQDSQQTAQQAEPSAAGKAQEPEVKTTSNTLEERRKAYQALIDGEYKDFYTEDTQRMIDRRFRETKNLEAQVSKQQPVIDMLMSRYRISDGDISKLAQAIENDDAYWSEGAEEAGMSVEQYKRFQQLERQNAALIRERQSQASREAAEKRLQQWYREGDALKAQFPSFDLAQESKNPQFLSMLKAGVPLEHAYKVMHMDEIVSGAAQNAAQQAEKRVADSVRAKGARPDENGTSSQSAFTIKDDPSKWDKKDRAEIARRVARGEIIKL